MKGKGKEKSLQIGKEKRYIAFQRANADSLVKMLGS
jgi:hypothetical protein